MKTPRCFAVVLCHSLYFQQPIPIIAHNGTSLRAVVLSIDVHHRLKSYSWQLRFQRGCTPFFEEPPFVHAALEERSQVALFVSSQGTNLEDSLGTADNFSLNKILRKIREENLNMLICAIYTK